MPDLKIDAEFQLLLPMSTKEELEQLENLLLRDGCREPIIATNSGTIVDGMTRFIICQKHKIPFTEIRKEFPSRTAVRIWIRENQIGRRNLTDAQRIDNAIELEKDRAGGNFPRRNIAETAAKVAKVDEKTVRSFQKADASPVKELGRMMKSGEVKIDAAAKVSELPVKEQRIIVRAGPAAVKEAARKVREGKPVTAPVDSPFPDSTLIDNALRTVAKLKGELVAVCGSADDERGADACGAYLACERQEFAKQLDAIRHTLKVGRPHATCPHCEANGKKCQWCKGMGWVCETVYRKAPKELQEKVKGSIQ